MSAPTDCLLSAPEEETRRLRLMPKAVLTALPDAVQDWCAQTGFTGAANQTCFIPDALKEEAGTDVFIGAAPDPTIWTLSAFAQNADGGSYELVDQLDPHHATDVAIGWILGQYRFDRYKKGATAKATNKLVLPKGADSEKVTAIATAIGLVRDLINTPAEDMGPAEIEAAAETLAAEYEASVTTLRGQVLKDAVFPAIHAVGRAAADNRAPRLIDMRWSGNGGPLLTLVGKGVAFDSGGLNIKPFVGMRWMKKDMGGAAHVLGIASAIMALNLPVQLRVLIPAVENAISGNAFRPGDILETRAGLSVEVGNTDAEGRLILCDTLTYACEEKPDLLIDFATLTGAARVAMGAEIPAVFCNTDSLWDGLEKASAETSDPIWRLPLYDGYRELLDSPIADLCNISDGPFAGAITAGLFLDSFVDHEVPWAHFDCFAWQPKAKPGRTMGGEAQGLRATLSYIEGWLAAQ